MGKPAVAQQVLPNDWCYLRRYARPCPGSHLAPRRTIARCRLITEAIGAVLATSPEVSPLDIEMVFRDAGSPVYLIGKPELTIVIGMPARRSALDRLGMSPQDNRYALAGTTGHS